MQTAQDRDAVTVPSEDTGVYDLSELWRDLGGSD